MKEFCEIIRNISKYTVNKTGDRYYGNASLRCSGSFLITKSNIPKVKLQPDDFVVATSENSSINAPIHKKIYDVFPNINYIIHGHAYLSMMIPDDPILWGMELVLMTKKKYKHGDVRVVKEIKKLLKMIEIRGFFMINIKDHGFMIGTDTIERMKLIFDRKLVTFNEIVK